MDVALLDGTFLDAGELPGRDMSEVPHPVRAPRRAGAPAGRCAARVRFIHLNHTNRLLWDAAARAAPAARRASPSRATAT